MFYDGFPGLTLGLTRSVKLRREPNKSIRKKLLSFQITASFSEWCHQGLMYPCKHLYLNDLPLAYIKKPRDWHV